MSVLTTAATRTMNASETPNTRPAGRQKVVGILTSPFTRYVYVFLALLANVIFDILGT